MSSYLSKQERAELLTAVERGEPTPPDVVKRLLERVAYLEKEVDVYRQMTAGFDDDD